MYEHKFPKRAREHEANHVRLLEVQTLDAILRIEELLKELVAAKAPKALAGPHADLPHDEKPKRSRK